MEGEAHSEFAMNNMATGGMHHSRGGEFGGGDAFSVPPCDWSKSLRRAIRLLVGMSTRIESGETATAEEVRLGGVVIQKPENFRSWRVLFPNSRWSDEVLYARMGKFEWFVWVRLGSCGFVSVHVNSD